LKLLPQVHVTVISVYFGWMPSFMVRPGPYCVGAAKNIGSMPGIQDPGQWWPFL
jgi:hypothetical protein